MNKNEEQLIKIGWTVAKRSRLEDKEEAFSVALLGIARGLKTYKENKKTKLTTYIYRCAEIECWAEWRRLHRKKRGGGEKEISLDEIIERVQEINEDI